MPRPRMFSQQQITDIWKSLVNTSSRELAKHYGVTQHAISCIVSGRSYADFSANVDPSIREVVVKAMTDRRTIKNNFEKRKLHVPTRETLLELLSVHQKKRKVADLMRVNISTMSDWCRLRKIKSTDYVGKKYLGLDTDDVKLIRELSKEISVYDVAEKFEVSVDTVCDVVCYRVWKTV